MPHIGTIILIAYTWLVMISRFLMGYDLPIDYCIKIVLWKINLWVVSAFILPVQCNLIFQNNVAFSGFDVWSSNVFRFAWLFCSALSDSSPISPNACTIFALNQINKLQHISITDIGYEVGEMKLRKWANKLGKHITRHTRWHRNK